MNASIIERLRENQTRIEIHGSKVQFFNLPGELHSALQDEAVEIGRRGKRVSRHLERLTIYSNVKDWRRLHQWATDYKHWPEEPELTEGHALLCSWLASHRTIADAYAAIRSGKEKPRGNRSREADITFHSRLLPMTEKALLQEAMLRPELTDSIMKLTAKNETDD